MSLNLPDYFARPSSNADEVLRRIKGNVRRQMIADHLQSGPLENIPEQWKQHSLPESLKAAMQAQDPQARGGEDLPDLHPAEVEIARMSLVESVHGEVASLRARRTQSGKGIDLRLVDEYQTDFVISNRLIQRPLTAAEVIEVFARAEPSPLATDMKVTFDSFYYSDLNSVARDAGIVVPNERSSRWPSAASTARGSDKSSDRTRLEELWGQNMSKLCKRAFDDPFQGELSLNYAILDILPRGLKGEHDSLEFDELFRAMPESIRQDAIQIAGKLEGLQRGDEFAQASEASGMPPIVHVAFSFRLAAISIIGDVPDSEHLVVPYCLRMSELAFATGLTIAARDPAFAEHLLEDELADD